MIFVDGEDDCQDGSDEQDCNKAPSVSCKGDEFACKSTHQCIPKSWLCDNEHVSQSYLQFGYRGECKIETKCCFFHCVKRIVTMVVMKTRVKISHVNHGCFHVAMVVVFTQHGNVVSINKFRCEFENHYIQ